MKKLKTLFDNLTMELTGCSTPEDDNTLSISQLTKVVIVSQQFRCMATVMCLSIGTPKNNKFSICSKWKIHYFLSVPKFGQITA